MDEEAASRGRAVGDESGQVFVSRTSILSSTTKPRRAHEHRELAALWRAVMREGSGRRALW
jgi:hypothetical protein